MSYGHYRQHANLKPLRQIHETEADMADLAVGRRVMAALYGEPTMGIREIGYALGVSHGTVFNDERRALAKLGRRVREIFAE